MAAGKRSPMGLVQLRIMGVLWRRGKATAREITEDLGRRRRIAHSTVQTLLRSLERRGAVGHEQDDRTFVFYPLVTKDEVARSSTRDLLSRLFGGSAYRLVAHLIREDMVSDKDIERIERLIREREGE
jgi:BlaI family penicillinase repressor